MPDFDAEIQELIANAPAGVNDVMQAYEYAEQPYMAAASAQQATVVVTSSNTTRR